MRAFGLLAAVAGALGLAGAAFALLRDKSQAPGPRFVLIEKQTDDASLPSSAALAAPSAPTSSGSSTASVPAARSARASHTDKLVTTEGSAVANPAQSLSAAFQRQRGKVEACFSSNPGDGAEQVTLQFQIDATGAVRGVELQPRALSNSSLGHCVLAVARATAFPPGPAPVSFSIPITARKKSR